MIFFDTLLQARDFKEAANSLALEFRQKHGLPGIHQLGLVVSDVEAAASELEARGMPPFFIAGGNAALWRERGEERRVRGKLGIAYREGFEVELLEPGEGSDFYRQSLDPDGKIVVQHLGLLVDDVDQWARRLEDSGSQTWVRGRIQTGPLHTNFAYMDTVAEAGLVIEFISFKLFRKPVSLPPRLIHAVGRVQKWTGMRSISV